MFVYDPLRTLLPGLVAPTRASHSILPHVEELKEFARRHEVCYEVTPEWSNSEDRCVCTGCEIELCGLLKHGEQDGAKHAVTGCSECIQTFEKMREVAEWILPTKDGVRYHIEPFDRAVHIAPPRRKLRTELVLNMVIIPSYDVHQSTEDHQQQYLTEIRDRLAELGIQESICRKDIQTTYCPSNLKENGSLNQYVNLVPKPKLASYGPTVFKTERNQHEVRCGMCGRTIYVDEATFNFVSEAIKSGLDDPFRCEICKEEYDDLAYEG